MDISDEYIKMCSAATELQDSWSFTDGDYIFDTLNNRAGVWSGYSAFDYPGYPTKEIHNSIWLPRQDQMQAIILKRFHDYGLDIVDRETIYILWRLQNWIRDQCFEEIAHLSFECIWMKFLMYSVYGKKWDGEHWL